MDDDLLNEGRRNIENHLQSLGYFQATARASQHTTQDGKRLQVVYTIDPGERHKMVAIRISGNEYFPKELIRKRMSEQTAGHLYPRPLQRSSARRRCSQHSGYVPGKRLSPGASRAASW